MAIISAGGGPDAGQPCIAIDSASVIALIAVPHDDQLCFY